MALRLADEQVEQAQPDRMPPPGANVGLQMIMIGMKALSMRFLIAISATYVLVLVSSAFFLWYAALESMSTNQIVGLSIYSIFIGFVIWRITRGQRQ